LAQKRIRQGPSVQKGARRKSCYENSIILQELLFLHVTEKILEKLYDKPAFIAAVTLFGVAMYCNINTKLKKFQVKLLAHK
jgi:hypothetical protein